MFCKDTHHYGGDVSAFEASNGHLQRLVHGRVDALADQLVQIDATAQQLDVALLQQGLVSEIMIHV